MPGKIENFPSFKSKNFPDIRLLCLYEVDWRTPSASSWPLRGVCDGPIPCAWCQRSGTKVGSFVFFSANFYSLPFVWNSSCQIASSTRSIWGLPRPQYVFLSPRRSSPRNFASDAAPIPTARATRPRSSLFRRLCIRGAPCSTVGMPTIRALMALMSSSVFGQTAGYFVF